MKRWVTENCYHALCSEDRKLKAELLLLALYSTTVLFLSIEILLA